MIFFVVYTLFYVLNHNLSKRKLSFLVLNTRLEREMKRGIQEKFKCLGK